MTNANIFKLIMNGLAAAPGIIDFVKQTVHKDNATKREKAYELTAKGLETLDEFAPQVRHDAKFQELVKKANDAIYEAAKYGQLLADQAPKVN